MNRGMITIAAAVALAIAGCSSSAAPPNPIAAAYHAECARLGTATAAVAFGTKGDQIAGQAMTAQLSDGTHWVALLRSAAKADSPDRVPLGNNKANDLQSVISGAVVDLDQAAIIDAGYQADPASATDDPAAWARQWGTFQSALSASKSDCS
jgi:hypothetical protein